MTKTVDGLLKLLYPGTEQAPADGDIEWAVRLALEWQRRMKEQQKRIGAAELRKTHFSYAFGEDGVEEFVATRTRKAVGNPKVLFGSVMNAVTSECYGPMVCVALLRVALAGRTTSLAVGHDEAHGLRRGLWPDSRISQS